MLAAGLADVLVADADPPVLGRVGDHPLDQLPVRLLMIGAAGDLGSGLGEAVGQGVAGGLELGQAEDPRPAGRSDGPVDAQAREGGGEELAELALHPRDLAAKLDPGSAALLTEVALAQATGGCCERIVPCVRIQC